MGTENSSMGDSSRIGGNLEDSGLLELLGKLMVVAILVLCFVVVFVFFLHLYAKWFWYRHPEDGSTASAASTRRRRRFDFAPGYQELTLTSRLRPGLDPGVLKSMPVLVYSAQDFRDGLECAVCLSEVFEGEKARLLPKCNHGFHVDCIDMWFQSHSTCPLCRDLVAPQSTVSEDTVFQTPAEGTSSANGFSSETPNVPTNVLFWGDETRVSTLELNLEENHQSGISSSSQTHCSSSSSSSSSSAGNRAEVSCIDIPRQINEEEEAKSPMTTRLRSLRRLLSWDRRANPSNIDLEQGSRNQS